MPKPKGYMRDIPQMYQYQYIDLIIFGYVQGMQKALPFLTVSDALKHVLKKLDLCEEVYCFNNCKTAYYNILRTYLHHNFNKDGICQKSKVMS